MIIIMILNSRYDMCGFHLSHCVGLKTKWALVLFAFSRSLSMATSQETDHIVLPGMEKHD